RAIEQEPGERGAGREIGADPRGHAPQQDQRAERRAECTSTVQPCVSQIEAGQTAKVSSAATGRSRRGRGRTAHRRTAAATSGIAATALAAGSTASSTPQPVAFARPPSKRWKTGHI